MLVDETKEMHFNSDRSRVGSGFYQNKSRTSTRTWSKVAFPTSGEGTQETLQLVITPSKELNQLYQDRTPTVKTKSVRKVFSTDLDFCPQCGTVLPLPGMEDVVTCKLCGFQIDVTDFDGIEIHTKLEVNRPESFITGQEEADTELKGPTADRKCVKCGHDEMIYTTRQTRSADEGQTVFFTCPVCRFQEIEYS